MRLLSVLFVLCAMSMSVFATEPGAEPKEKAVQPVEDGDAVMVSMKTELLSKNIVRGERRNDEAVVQSTTEIKKDMFELEFFGNTDLTDSNDSQTDITEFGIRAGIDKQVYEGQGIVKSVNALAGVEYFGYPNVDRDATVEVYTGASVVLPYEIVSESMVNVDVDEAAGGFYMSEAISRKFNLTTLNVLNNDWAISTTPKIGVGGGSAEYNDYYWGVDEFCTTNAFAELSLKATADKMEFGPSVRYETLVGDDMLDEVSDNENMVYGFSFGYKF
jgi:hypothetical protein